MLRTNGVVELTISGDVEKVSPDNTVGLVETTNPDEFPESLLVDPERLERALIAVRKEFENPTAINIALVREDDDDNEPDIALYGHDRRNRAIVIAPRYRNTDDGIEQTDIQTVDVEGDSR